MASNGDRPTSRPRCDPRRAERDDHSEGKTDADIPHPFADKQVHHLRVRAAEAATRSPISRVRIVTPYAITPNVPMAANWHQDTESKHGEDCGATPV